MSLQKVHVRRLLLGALGVFLVAGVVFAIVGYVTLSNKQEQTSQEIQQLQTTVDGLSTQNESLAKQNDLLGDAVSANAEAINTLTKNQDAKLNLADATATKTGYTEGSGFSNGEYLLVVDYKIENKTGVDLILNKNDIVVTDVNGSVISLADESDVSSQPRYQYDRGHVFLVGKTELFSQNIAAGASINGSLIYYVADGSMKDFRAALNTSEASFSVE